MKLSKSLNIFLVFCLVISMVILSTKDSPDLDIASTKGISLIDGKLVCVPNRSFFIGGTNRLGDDYGI